MRLSKYVEAEDVAEVLKIFHVVSTFLLFCKLDVSGDSLDEDSNTVSCNRPKAFSMNCVNRGG